jgi:hypothetical protein
VPPSLRDLPLPYAIAYRTGDLAGNHRETFMARTPIDIVALDSRLEEELAKYGSAKDFHVVLRQGNPDAPGCNWNARIERVRSRNSSDSTSWWDVVPQMRERFNLT